MPSPPDPRAGTRGTPQPPRRSSSWHRWPCAPLSPTPAPMPPVHTPPCPPDDADLAELKQELEAVGDFRHRSPSRSLSVPSRPRPPHPPQRPPPPSKTLLPWPSTPAGNNCVFAATEQMALNHLLPGLRVPQHALCLLRASRLQSMMRLVSEMELCFSWQIKRPLHKAALGPPPAAVLRFRL